MLSLFIFFFNHTATTKIYTLSLHDALPISNSAEAVKWLREAVATGFLAYPLFERDALLDKIRKAPEFVHFMTELDRKSTRLNSSHSQISYAVFCLKKKTKQYPLIIYSYHNT